MISMKKKDFTPLVMWLCLIAGIIVLAFIRSSRMIGVWNEYPVNFDIIFISSYILWMLIELRISRRDVHTEGKKTSDFATCQIYGLGQALTFLTALWFPSVLQVPNIAHIVGISIFLFGVCYRLWAIRTLGQFYSHRVRAVDQHQIVVSGPYRFTRHPAYAGMIIANAGICIFFFNWVTVNIFLFILVPAILLRIVIEERMLFGIEGYSEFAKKRKRLFPAVW
jgi:protein-S-isoprenylcysteine O-methyltransferase Ste14